MKPIHWIGLLVAALFAAGVVMILRRRDDPGLRRFFRHPLASFSLGWLIFLIAAALFAPVLAPFRPSRQLDIVGMINLSPSWQHPMGTDMYSRDILSRVLFGARVSLGVGALAMLVAITAGGLVGTIAGYFRRGVDGTLMRLVDVGLAVPRIFIILVAIALWDRMAVLPLIVVLGITGWFGTSRLVRAEVMVLRSQPFVDAARAMGASHWRVDAILITHEHSDHIAGLRVLANKYRIPVYMTGATHQAWKRDARDSRKAGTCKDQPCSLDSLEVFEAGRSFAVGDICITPFTIPHDAADPVGFTMRVDGVKISIATDLGYLPASVKHHLRGSDVLLIESNHDLEMLRNGPYPWVVKQRVMSRVGHLSNAALAEFLVTDYDGSAAYVILAHLSEQNNHPELVRSAAERALERHTSLLLQNRIMLARQPEPLDPIRL